MTYSSYYVVDSEGNTLAGPFGVESVAEDWLSESDHDGYVISTGACDLD